MDDLIEPILAITAFIVVVIFDWPRALAGLIVGILGRVTRRPWQVIPAGIVLVAAGGEAVYALLGRGASPSWGSFATGLLVAGLCSLGVARLIRGFLASD